MRLRRGARLTAGLRVRCAGLSGAVPGLRGWCVGLLRFTELFLDEVRVPVGNRVGAEHDGWRVTMVTLSF
ncbi:hypothetical protein ABT168_37385, partial [Streptomyces sp. NPDC001793]|uniref:hypothetical protein n=1 Tax=Streptomyces sp. NPDC001793 TaxID=3154657 RepID=UPI00331E66DC